MTEHSAEPPEPLPFRQLDRAWSVSVAEHLLWAHRSLPDPSMTIDECWLTGEHAIYIRHRRGDSRVGVRFGHLDINPTTETAPVDSGQEGVYLYHSIYDTPPETKLTDRFGYEWWGDDPVGSDWAEAIHRKRELTLVGYQRSCTCGAINSS